MIRARRAIHGIALLLGVAGAAHAVPPEAAIIPLDHYKSQTARSLATTYSPLLRQIYNNVYHCRPWLDVNEHGLGFRIPRGVEGDGFYLSIWVWVEQVITPEFSAMPPADRASAMFSRYGVDLLRRLSAHPELSAERELAGYSVVLSWYSPSPGAKPGTELVAETLAVSVDKTTIEGFFSRTVTPTEFADRAVVAAFDGKHGLGRLPLEIWDDSLPATFKLKGC